MQGSSSSSAAGVGLLFTHRCSVICTGEHTRSQWSATLAGGVEVEAFFPALHRRTTALQIRENFLGRGKCHPSVDFPRTAQLQSLLPFENHPSVKSADQ